MLINPALCSTTYSSILKLCHLLHVFKRHSETRRSDAGATRETIVVGDGLASQQHIANRSGIAEFSCHNSTDASAGKLILLTSSGEQGSKTLQSHQVI